MSWVDKLKSIFKEEKAVEEKKIEKVSLEDLYFKVEEKLKEQNGEKELLKKEVLKRIERFAMEMSKAIEVLENVDLTKRKDYERIKIIVTENLSLYITQSKKLIGNVKSVESLEVKEALSKLSFYFNEFNRVSYAPFEKATILVGNELVAIKNILREFVKDCNKVFNDNKIFFDEIETSENLNSLVSRVKQNRIYEEELNQKVSGLNDSLKKEKEKYETAKQKIEDAVNSEDYRDDIKEKEKHREKLIRLEKEIESVKQKINLKSLSKWFHYDKKKSQIIKDYSKDFKSVLLNDHDLIILDLVKEAQGSEIDGLGELQLKIPELSKHFTTKTDEKIAELENDLSKFEADIKNIERSIEYEQNKKNKLAAKKEKTLLEIKKFSQLLFPNFVFICQDLHFT